MNITKQLVAEDDIIALLETHHREMMKHSPPESVHALDSSALRSAEHTFWKATVDEQIAGCGALKELDRQRGEIKAMKIADGFLRQGVAVSILREIIKEAETRGYKALFLETGSMHVFEPARQLYSTVGFDFCEPFGNYSEDPHSVFMQKCLLTVGEP